MILDYRPEPLRPSVLRLRYEYLRGPKPAMISHWVGVARTFDDFADLLGL